MFKIFFSIIIFTLLGWAKSVTVHIDKMQNATIECFQLKPFKKRIILYKPTKNTQHIFFKKINPNALYLIKASNAKGAVLHALISGKELMQSKKINLSIASELLYERFAARLKSDFTVSDIIAQINNEADTILLRDINADGKINNQDILSFSLISDKMALRTLYRFKEALAAPYKGKTPILFCKSFFSSYKSGDIISLILFKGHIWALWQNSKISDLALKNFKKIHLKENLSNAHFLNHPYSKYLFLQSKKELLILDANNPAHIIKKFARNYDDAIEINSKIALLKDNKLNIYDTKKWQITTSLSLSKNYYHLFKDSKNRVLYITGEGPLLIYKFTKNGKISLLKKYSNLVDIYELSFYANYQRALAIMGSAMNGVSILDTSNPLKIKKIKSSVYEDMSYSPIRVAKKRALLRLDNMGLVLFALKKNNLNFLGSFDFNFSKISNYWLTKDAKEAWIMDQKKLYHIDTTIYSSLFSIENFYLGEIDTIVLSSNGKYAYVTVWNADSQKLFILKQNKNKWQIVSHFPSNKDLFFESMDFALLDNNRAIAADDESHVYLLNLHKGVVKSYKEIKAIEQISDSWIECMQPLNHGNYLLIGFKKGKLALFKSVPNKEIKFLSTLHFKGAIKKIIPINPKQILVLIKNKGVALLKVEKEKLKGKMVIKDTNIAQILTDIKHEIVYTVAKNNSVKKYALKGNKLQFLHSFNIPYKNGVFALLNDGKLLFANNKIYSLKDFKFLGKYPGKISKITPLPGKQEAFVAEDANFLMYWDFSLLK